MQSLKDGSSVSQLSSVIQRNKIIRFLIFTDWKNFRRCELHHKIRRCKLTSSSGNFVIYLKEININLPAVTRQSRRTKSLSRQLGP